MITLGIGLQSNSPKVEDRAGYTDVLVDAILARAAGKSGAGNPRTSSALEISAGWWARGLAAAVVTPALASLDAGFFYAVGHDLARFGNSVWDLRVEPNGELTLLPASDWDVSGGPSPSSWLYRLQLDGPSLSETVTRPRASVLHFKLSADRRRPWCGLSPLDWAIETGSLNGALEKSLASEASMPVGSIVPMPEGTKVTESFKTALNNLAGKVALPETASGGHGDLAQAPRRDWDPRRLGPAPTAAEVDLRMQTEVSICALYGISPSMVSAVSDGTAMKETWRRTQTGVFSVLGRIVASELERAIELPFTFSFAPLRALDLAANARAVHVLAQSGIAVDKALELAGFD